MVALLNKPSQIDSFQYFKKPFLLVVNVFIYVVSWAYFLIERARETPNELIFVWGTYREVNTRRLIDKTKIDNEYRGNKEEYLFFYRFKGTEESCRSRILARVYHPRRLNTVTRDKKLFSHARGKRLNKWS